MSLRKYRGFLALLAIVIVGLMALGAGVRTMNAGLSCPDWPLCFGKVIPDFHVGVWFEFVHRAYAGLVALLFLAALIIAFRSKEVPQRAKTAAKWGLGFLSLQILMGGLTVLLLVKAVVVTTHLLLATLFLSCVVWMLLAVHAELRAPKYEAVPEAKHEERRHLGCATLIKALPFLVFIQIAIGGLVASTYAGSVCVDWPLCNGQWVPTWKGAIGLQIIHRFVAYGWVLLFLALSIAAFLQRSKLAASTRRFFYAGGVIVSLQTVVGILNLVFFIPAHLTVLHQTLAMALLCVSLKLAFDAHHETAATTSSERLTAAPAPLS